MRPLILVTNDDGICCVGLRAAAEAARMLGDLLIVAPATQQTGMGRSFPSGEDQGTIRLISRPLGGKSTPHYSVNGSPAQAVAHAVLEIAPRPPTLCISGINIGENLGGTNMISGTVGAAYEATCFGIPALAVSVGPEERLRSTSSYVLEDWQVSSVVIRRFASIILDRGLAPNVALLNINIPATATLETEIRTTSQSRQNQYVCTSPGPRDFLKPFRLPVAEKIDFGALEPDSDARAFLVDRVVSVTPMGYDLTARDSSGAPVDISTGPDETQGRQ